MGNSASDLENEVERALLAALCQGVLQEDTRQIVLRRLERHTFSTSEHEIIFQAASKLPAGTLRNSRELLMITLTRMGFPDFDLAPFFNIVAPAENEIPSLLEEL